MAVSKHSSKVNYQNEIVCRLQQLLHCGRRLVINVCTHSISLRMYAADFYALKQSPGSCMMFPIHYKYKSSALAIWSQSLCMTYNWNCDRVRTGLEGRSHSDRWIRQSVTPGEPWPPNECGLITSSSLEHLVKSPNQMWDEERPCAMFLFNLWSSPNFQPLFDQNKEMKGWQKKPSRQTCCDTKPFWHSGVCIASLCIHSFLSLVQSQVAAWSHFSIQSRSNLQLGACATVDGACIKKMLSGQNMWSRRLLREE